MGLMRSLKYKTLIHMFILPICMYIVLKSARKEAPEIKEITRFLTDVKHILLWTDIHGLEPEGQTYFLNKKCEYINCYFTKNKSLFGDIGYFDLILFNVQDVSRHTKHLPRSRIYNQKYVFVANDSADNYPVCDAIYDDFFNWTWTYRYDSTISYRFITIYNSAYEELGSHFQWKRNMKPIDEKIKSQLSTKSKAAIIFLDKCFSRSRREIFLGELKKELQKLNLEADIFGKCGTKDCRRRTMQPCYWRVKKMYYFYLAFEDSKSLDYISDIVLNAYNNYAVPIVYGGADYDRFLPPGSYIDAGNKSMLDLARNMHNIIHNRELYYDFFRWQNHYIISKSSPVDACELCAFVNYPARLIHRSSYKKFRKWWNPEFERRCEESNQYSML
ncbi:unnamed protein product [Leptosia nina]|uniref:Fucosyltransferase n=1 Tax=Leptosia nina TaxID=320188 RepID=A0AAV1IZ87_9NEOP